MARKRLTITEMLNNFTAKTIYDKFSLLSQSAFDWEGLPDGIQGKYIERYLFTYGKAIFFKDPKMRYMCLEAQDTGAKNVYNEPTEWRATGFNYNQVYQADNCVIIDNNPLRIATDNLVKFYCLKISEAERTMDVNIKRCKTPYIFACDDKDVMTLKKVFGDIDGNVPAIFADRGLHLEAINVFNTGVQFLGNELMDYKKSVENELLTLLGVNNLAVDKKERVNLSEANSNNQLTEAFADLQLKSRELACEQINTKYKLNVTVKRKEVINNVDNINVQHQQDNT